MPPIETHHGKPALAMPRASDLTPAPAREVDPRRGRGWKKRIREMLPRRTGEADVDRVAEDAAGVFASVILECSTDGPLVRLQAQRLARHEALCAFFAHRAAEAGLVSDEARALGELSLRHSGIATRLAVVVRALADTAKRRDRGADGDKPWLVER